MIMVPVTAIPYAPASPLDSLNPMTTPRTGDHERIIDERDIYLTLHIA